MPYGTPTGEYDFQHLFGGYYYDSDTGLYLVRNRIYHPKLGRWLTKDPLGMVDGPNLYEYCAGDPVNLIDPSGELWSWGFAGLGALGGAVAGAVGYGALGWMGEDGYTWGGLGGAVAGGAVSGALVGGVIGAGTGDPTFLGVVGIGLAGGLAYGATESVVRQSIDRGRVDLEELAWDTGASGLIGGVTAGTGFVFRQPLTTFGRQFAQGWGRFFQQGRGLRPGYGRRLLRTIYDTRIGFKANQDISKRLLGRLLRRLGPFDMDHVFISQALIRRLTARFPLLGEQLRRIGNSGINLVPLPRYINRGLLNRKVLGIHVYRYGFTGIVGYTAYSTLNYTGHKIDELYNTLADLHELMYGEDK